MKIIAEITMFEIIKAKTHVHARLARPERQYRQNLVGKTAAIDVGFINAPVYVEFRDVAR